MKTLRRTVVAALAAAALLGDPADAGATPVTSVPPTVGYQGRLTDASGHPIDATVSVTFAVYGAPTGGTPLWTETQSVAFANGYFAVQLGATTPLGTTFAGAPRYLGVAVGADPEMTPRATIGSVPYALAAASALSAPPDGRFGASTSLAAAGNGATCTLGAVWLTAGSVAAGTPAAGQLLSISAYAALFSLIGTTYGGDGVNNFALPDLRGAAPNGLTYVICATTGVYPARS